MRLRYLLIQISGIFEYPKGCDKWYILRCVEHNLNWQENSTRAAAKHLLGSAHQCGSKKLSLAIAELGELVEHCDREKANASNAEYQAALDQGYKPNNHMKQRRRKRQTKPAQKRRNSAKSTTGLKSGHEPAGMFEGVIDPVVGEVYYAWWDAEPRSWYLVVILPYLGDVGWKEVGIAGSLFTSGLKTAIPNCFKVARIPTNSGQEALRLIWAEGYQDGGPKVRARKFPCLFLHDPLKIPSADQEFVLGRKAEVLAFRTAQQLRHRSTILAPGLSKIGVDAYQGLAQDFEARLREIRAKRNPAPEQEVQDNAGRQASSVRDEQRPSATTTVEAERSPCASSASDVQNLHHHSAESDFSLPGDEHRGTSACDGLGTRNPRVSLPSYVGNGLIAKSSGRNRADLNERSDSSTYHSATPTTSTTDRPSPNDQESGGRLSAESWTSQATSRQAQPMKSSSQNKGSPPAEQESSGTSQTAASPSQRPRADEHNHPSETGEQGPVQGIHDSSNTSHGKWAQAKLSDVSRSLQSSGERIEESGCTFRPLDRSPQGTVTPIPSKNLQGPKSTKVVSTSTVGAHGTASASEASVRASEPRGPTALRPIFRFRKENADHSNGSSRQDKAPSLRNTVSTVEKDIVPVSAGQTSWTPSYSEMLRQPWRSPLQVTRRPGGL